MRFDNKTSCWILKHWNGAQDIISQPVMFCVLSCVYVGVWVVGGWGGGQKVLAGVGEGGGAKGASRFNEA